MKSKETARRGSAGNSAWCAGIVVFYVIALLGNSTANAELPFTQEGQVRGVVYSTPVDSPSPFPYGRGLAFVDLDNDGDPDLVTTGSASFQVGLFENLGGTFVNRQATCGIPPMQMASGVVAFDYDGDADLDLFISQWGMTDKLLRNDGGLTFTDVSTAMGVDSVGPATGPTVADFDGDGWLDLCVSQYGAADLLYRNDAGQGFQEVAAASGVTGIFNTLQSAFFDMDMDGDKDLYTSSDRRTIYNTTEHNRLFENNGGAFTDISAGSGTDIQIMSMNIGLADLDHNGYLDIYCTNLTVPDFNLFYSNVLMMNAGDGTFTQQQVAAGVESYRFGWGAVFMDFDNDTTQDLYVCNQIGENRLYVNKGLWPLDDEATKYNVNLGGDSRCVAIADIDADGDLDMAVQKYDDSLRLYINHEGEARNHLRIAPVGLWPNRHAIGAIVQVRTGSLWQMQELLAGSNYKVQNELIAHFGMDDALLADEVIVRWNDGAQRTLVNVPVNQVLRVYHPSLMGDPNEDGFISASELQIFLDAAMGNPVADTARFDFDGNGQIDGNDIQGMADRLIGV